MKTALTVPTTRNLKKVGGILEKKYLIFNSGLDIKVADPETDTIDTLFSFSGEDETTRPAWLESLAYHNNNLWVGCAYIGIRNLKDKNLIPRAQTVFSLVSYKGKLYDAGSYGIRETLTNKVIVSKKDLSHSGVYKISDFFTHRGKLMAVCEWNVPGGLGGHMLRNVERDSEIVTPYGNQSKIKNHGLKSGKAAILDEGILTTLASTYVDEEEDWLLLNEEPVEGTQIKYGEYKSIAFDRERRMLYAAIGRPRRTWYEPKQITAFEVHSYAGKVVCNPVKEVAINLSDVAALLLVNERQLELIKTSKT